MFGSHTAQRLVHWLTAFRGVSSGSRRSGQTKRRTESRSLRLEGLEHRTLLSVSGIGNETFKTVLFNASGTTKSSFTAGGYQISVNGTTSFTKGAIVYDSPTHGVIAENGAQLSGSGTFTAKGRGTGRYSIQGFAHQITDDNGALTGSVEVTKTTTTPNVGLSFNDTYDLANATFDTRNFALSMNLVNPDGSTLSFNGKLNPEGSAFNVIVNPQWRADGTIFVGVQVPGKPHITASANRMIPVTNVQLFWAKGTRVNNKIGAALSDKIPIYWNQASGEYIVSNLPSAPSGATHLLFVTQVDRSTRVAALPLPGLTVAATGPVAEGNGGENPNVADFKVALSRPMASDVTVRYTTVAGSGSNAAKPNVDFVPAAGAIVIPAGQTEGHILVPIIGNTKFEPNKNFSLKLTRASNAVVNPERRQAPVTIVNDDARPTISITDVNAVEGHNGNTQFVFQVTLSNPSYQTVKVKYKTNPGTATVGTDFGAKSLATLSFAPGKTVQNVVVLVKGDTAVEQDETFFVDLSSPSNATIAKGRGIGTILNDDGGIGVIPSLAHNAAIAQFGGRAELASVIEPQGRDKDKDDQQIGNAGPLWA